MSKVYSIKNNISSMRWKHYEPRQMTCDPFLDSYDEEILTCCDILDHIGFSLEDSVLLKINKLFLRKIIHSHIAHIRKLAEE